MRRAWLVLLVLAIAGCGGGGGGGKAGAGGDEGLRVDGQPVPARRLTAAVEGLCAARADAPGDLTRARNSFYDRSHEMLHVIAAGLEPVDRAQAARLLEAKQAVESHLDASGPVPSLAPDLDRLIEVTRTGLARLDFEAPSCEQ